MVLYSLRIASASATLHGAAITVSLHEQLFDTRFSAGVCPDVWTSNKSKSACAGCMRLTHVVSAQAW